MMDPVVQADGALLRSLLARAQRRRDQLADLAGELEGVADRLRGWLTRIPVEAGDWRGVSARAYGLAAQELHAHAEWAAAAAEEALAGVRAQILRADEQCERVRAELRLQYCGASVYAGSY